MVAAKLVVLILLAVTRTKPITEAQINMQNGKW
jgi:hypothetical protein